MHCLLSLTVYTDAASSKFKIIFIIYYLRKTFKTKGICILNAKTALLLQFHLPFFNAFYV